MTKTPAKAGKSRKPGTFVKGDPRINRAGKKPGIDSFAALRKEYQRVWAEVLRDDKGKPILDPETKEALTRLTARLRVSTSSRNPREFELGLMYGYGKPREEIDITSDGKPIMPTVIEIIKTYKDE